MKVVLVKPGKPAELADLETLEDMQKAVGGNIEAVYPWKAPLALVYDDDGKAEHLPLNRPLIINKQLTDVIAGTFFVCGVGEEDFTGLTDKQAEQLLKDLSKVPDPEYLAYLSEFLI